MSKVVAKKASVKKTVDKKPVAAKTSAKTTVDKKSAKVKTSAKKVSTLKSSVVKKSDEVKTSPKKTSVTKKVVEKEVPDTPKPPKSAAELSEETTAAASRDFAFSFAEMMKKANRNEEAKMQSEALTVKLSRRPTSRTKGKDSLKFPAADLAEFKKRLLQLREAATGHSATLKNVALEQSDERVSEDEDGSDAFLRLQSLNQADSQNRLIRKIDEALVRIEDGSYGICEMCGQLIRKPRLLNMPFVHTCMECQSAMEAPYGGR